MVKLLYGSTSWCDTFIRAKFKIGFLRFDFFQFYSYFLRLFPIFFRAISYFYKFSILAQSVLHAAPTPRLGPTCILDVVRQSSETRATGCFEKVRALFWKIHSGFESFQPKNVNFLSYFILFEKLENCRPSLRGQKVDTGIHNAQKIRNRKELLAYSKWQ